VLTAEDIGHWRQATEPVIAAWQKQMKERKLDGAKLLAAVHELVAKYADEPQPQPAQPSQPSQASPSPEQKAVTEPPQAQPPQGNAEAQPRPKTEAPAVDAPAPSTTVTKPAPAVATKPKELDIPL
jgi:hypothetical protein